MNRLTNFTNVSSAIATALKLDWRAMTLFALSTVIQTVVLVFFT
jgi:hypothetical protein